MVVESIGDQRGARVARKHWPATPVDSIRPRASGVNEAGAVGQLSDLARHESVGVVQAHALAPHGTIGENQGEGLAHAQSASVGTFPPAWPLTLSVLRTEALWTRAVHDGGIPVRGSRSQVRPMRAATVEAVEAEITRQGSNLQRVPKFKCPQRASTQAEGDLTAKMRRVDAGREAARFRLDEPDWPSNIRTATCGD